MVLPESAHAAFHKAASYFGITVHKTKVRDDWRALRPLVEWVADNAE